MCFKKLVRTRSSVKAPVYQLLKNRIGKPFLRKRLAFSLLKNEPWRLLREKIYPTFSLDCPQRLHSGDCGLYEMTKHRFIYRKYGKHILQIITIALRKSSTLYRQFGDTRCCLLMLCFRYVRDYCFEATETDRRASNGAVTAPADDVSA